MRLLILGGTRFVGRHLAEAAVARGDTVTLFHRGLTDPGAVPGAEHVHGDREHDLGLLSGRDFDWVLDTSGYLPRVVRASVEAVPGAAYCFVSSVSAYADLSAPVTEESGLREPEWEREEVDEVYGELKAACEQVVAAAGRALVVRPGLIVGPQDPTGRFSYWPRRIARGGDVLVPGPPDRQVQFVDARDLAVWLLGLLDSGASGAVNAISAPISMAAVLDTCLAVTGSAASIAWAGEERLLAEGVEPWTELPLWLGGAEWRGMMDIRPARVPARPLEATIRDILAEREPAAGQAGMDPEREAALLAGLRADPGRL